MEYTKANITYIPLRDELSEKIQVATEIVGDITKDSDADMYVAQLNGELRDAHLIGESVNLISQWMVWYSERIEDGQVITEPVIDPQFLKKLSADGTFIGVENMEVDKQRTLMYRVSVGFDDETMSYRTVIAPVEDAKLLVAMSGSHEAKIAANITAATRTLNVIEDPKFRETLRDFLDILGQVDELDATAIREIGILCTWLMAHEQVRDTPKLRRALGKIIKAVIDDDETYHIEGYEVVPNENEGETTVKSYQATVGVYGVGLIDDFEIDQAGEIEFLPTQQPAIITVDADDNLHYIPLRYVHDYSVIFEEPCRSSMQRFLAAYPGLWKTMAHVREGSEKERGE